MVADEWRSPRRARTWKGHALRTTTGAVSVKHSHCQLRNCNEGTIDTTKTGTASSAVTRSRLRSCRVASAPAVSAVSSSSPWAFAVRGGLGNSAV